MTKVKPKVVKKAVAPVAEPVAEPAVEIEVVAEPEVDTPEITPVVVDHGAVASIYRVMATDGTAFLNVVFADGAVEQHPCDDEKFAAFQADESDWAAKAEAFYGSL